MIWQLILFNFFNNNNNKVTARTKSICFMRKAPHIHNISIQFYGYDVIALILDCYLNYLLVTDTCIAFDLIHFVADQQIFSA